MAAARDTLDRLADRFPDNPDIQLELANGGNNADVYHSTSGAATQLGRGMIGLAARRCPTDDRIQALAHRHGLSFVEQLQHLKIVQKS